MVRLRLAQGPCFHPWVFRRQIKHLPAGLVDGEEVIVATAGGEPLARGFYHSSSQIAVRLLTSDPSERLDEEFLRRRLEAAAALRRDVLGLERQTDAWRVVHSEADGLSGLIVDRYGGLLVVELFSRGFFERRRLVEKLLLELFPGATVRFQVDALAGEREGMALSAAEAAAGGVVEIRESKMRFLVDPAGHKTGFFLDQRENRQRFAALVRGRKVLDAFCYTGGFAIAASTLGKAARVVAVDLDEEAVAQGRRNAQLNRTEIEWLHADVFKYLRHQRHAVEPFDAMVIDPPKWALARDRLEEAERRYIDVNTYALRALRPGGILLTCSCSGLISEETFLRLLRHAATLAERRLQLLHIGGAAADHPVAIHCPESRYLKAVLGRVL
jgi:23S rRNA (cytosine1962-C5)-methyltransferase